MDRPWERVGERVRVRVRVRERERERERESNAQCHAPRRKCGWEEACQRDGERVVERRRRRCRGWGAGSVERWRAGGREAKRERERRTERVCESVRGESVRVTGSRVRQLQPRLTGQRFSIISVLLLLAPAFDAAFSVSLQLAPPSRPAFPPCLPLYFSFLTL
jgi:hypothetical protein